jgi:hypothetical protein
MIHFPKKKYVPKSVHYTDVRFPPLKKKTLEVILLTATADTIVGFNVGSSHGNAIFSFCPRGWSISWVTLGRRHSVSGLNSVESCKLLEAFVQNLVYSRTWTLAADCLRHKLIYAESS